MIRMNEVFDIYTNGRGCILDPSPQLALVLEMPPQVLQGKELFNFITRGDVQKIREAIRVLYKTGGHKFEARFRPRNRAPLFSGEVIALRKGNEIRWTVFVTSIEPRKQEHSSGDISLKDVGDDDDDNHGPHIEDFGDR